VKVELRVALVLVLLRHAWMGSGWMEQR
jgi:hypothetical protein